VVPPTIAADAPARGAGAAMRAAQQARTAITSTAILTKPSSGS
jgi:hypothetical protein